MRRLFIALIAALVAMPLGVAATQQDGHAAEFSIRADKGGYVVGEAATVTVAGLTECADQIVSIGMRDAARGVHFAARDVRLDAEGNGSATVALLSDNDANPVQAAVWASCVDRGFEPGLALSTFPLLISVSFNSQDELVGFLPSGAEPIARAVIRGDVAATIGSLVPGEVIKTAYPGDGGPVSSDTARTDLQAMLVSGAGSDVYGVGRLGLLGVWSINGHFALLASGFGPDGDRHVVALGIDDVTGRWAITSYGQVVLSTGIMGTYAEQFDVRLAKIAPGSPATGNSFMEAGSTHQYPATGALVLATALGLFAAATLARRRHRRSD